MLRLILCILTACNVHSQTPNANEESTYKVITNDGTYEYQGTAWAVAGHYLVTAGHMCDSQNTGSKRSYTLVANTGRHYPAEAEAWEKDEDGESDLCVLRTPVSLKPLPLAYEMPQVGQRVGYVGYPNGIRLETEGQYLGDLDPDPGTHANDAVFSAPCDHGASGSAVYILPSHRVWGVLVRLRTDGLLPHLGVDGCVAVDLPHLRAMLARLGVPK